MVLRPGTTAERRRNSVWNAFLPKRGWRDEASDELAAAKKDAGFGDRDDIQTWMDLHDAEEGEKARRSVDRRNSESAATHLIPEKKRSSY